VKSPRWFLALLPLVGLLALRGKAETQGDPHGPLQMDCAVCHSPDGWKVEGNPLEFRHEKVGFTLDGSHSGTSCRSCHRSLVFNQVGTACADCHKDPHQGELGFRCEACHTSRTWTNRHDMFQKHPGTLFPLLATHANIDCESCHRGQQPNQYATTPTECGTCHVRSFNNARSPNHVTAGFSRRCEDCHLVNSTTWYQTNYHHPDTYPLIGAHASARCGDCHTTTYRGTPRNCVSCHLKDYNGTTDPNHRAGNFPTTCNSCHSETAWRPARSVNHNLTRFPLTGAHQQVDCGRCHVNGRFAGTPTDCFSCHQADYNGTTNPNHSSSGFPKTCQDCHSTTSWAGANFDHNKTRFPLTGAHRSVDCARCHPGNRFAGTPTDCYACHKANYDATSNPNHQAAGFPTQCANCHSTNSWAGATFDHDGQFFPINSGRHRGVWSRCSDCHTNPNNYATFECINCHTHNKADTDSHHRGVGGYRYVSTACYSCHPRGVAGDSAGRPVRKR
jgi:Zn finger protein HypA/HybF involved in hydrogenase expression